MPPGTVPIEAASIDVHPGEVTNASAREALATVFERAKSEVGEHLSATEIGPSNVPDSSARIIGEIDEPDVSGEN